MIEEIKPAMDSLASNGMTGKIIMDIIWYTFICFMIFGSAIIFIFRLMLKPFEQQIKAIGDSQKQMTADVAKLTDRLGASPSEDDVIKITNEQVFKHVHACEGKKLVTELLPHALEVIRDSSKNSEKLATAVSGLTTYLTIRNNNHEEKR